MTSASELVEDAGAGRSQERERARLRRLRRREALLPALFWLPAILVVGIVVVLPVGWLLWLSAFNQAGQPSFENYARLISGAIYRGSFVITFEVSFLVTGFCMLLGYPLAYMLVSLPRRAAGICMIFVLLPFWISSLVRTYAWIVLLQRTGIVNDLLLRFGLVHEPLQLAYNMRGTVIGMTHVLLPFLVLPLYAAMQSIDQDLVRAAMSLGSSPAGAFFRVFFPMSLPGLFGGTLMVFILSLGFYVTPALLGGGRVQMLAERLQTTINLYANWGAASALGAVLLVLAALMVWLLNRIFGLDRLFLR